jgi:general secretion pathway protein G
MFRRNRSFTLIELMIVMAIIAVLVGMILPRFKGIRDQASVSKAQGEVRAIKTAVESYYIRNGAYPTLAQYNAGILWAAATYPRILYSALYDPFGATATTLYRYAVSPAPGAYYVIWSIGPDGVAGITGITAAGAITGTVGDAVYTSNATGT